MSIYSAEYCIKCGTRAGTYDKTCVNCGSNVFGNLDRMIELLVTFNASILRAFRDIERELEK